MDIPQFDWDIEQLLVPTATDHGLHTHSPPALPGRYSSRLVPYWFSYHLLLTAHAEAHDSALDVLEIHPDLGQLKAYMDKLGGRPRIRRWDAAGSVLQRHALVSHDYGRCFETDTSGHTGPTATGIPFEEPYDVIFLLHNLEHQRHAASFLCSLAASLQPGGVIIGASSQHGRGGQRMTPRRLRQLARDCGLMPGLICGSVWGWQRGYLRKTEGWRLRAGLLFGALLPSLSRELYWVLQLPPERPA